MNSDGVGESKLDPVAIYLIAAIERVWRVEPEQHEWSAISTPPR